jgi:hypothetical protein
MYLRLLSAHRSRCLTFSPRVFRAEVTELLVHFPSNGFVLDQLRASFETGAVAASAGSLRAAFEKLLSPGLPWDHPHASATGSSDPVEALLQRAETITRQPAVAPPIVWLHAVSAELHRPGAVHRIESLLERALMQPHVGLAGVSGLPPLLLWRLLLRVHVCRGHADRAAKVLYRALHSCPGSKQLWLDGIEWIYVLRTALEAKAAAAIAVPSPATTSSARKPASVSAAATSSVSAATNGLNDAQLHELFELLQEKEIRHRINLLPERESDSVYVPIERAWDRHLRLQAEEEAARQRRKAERRAQREERKRRRSSRSRSRSSEDDSDARRHRHWSDSETDGSSGRRSRSRSRSYSRSRSRSRSSSAERWERTRRLERAPLPTRDDLSD